MNRYIKIKSTKREVNKNKKIYPSEFKLYFLFLIIILALIMIINIYTLLYSSFKRNNIRKLQEYNNQNVSQKKKEDEYIDPIILFFFIFFILFISICLYLICELKSKQEKLTEYTRENIWKFIYITNNGFFLTAISYTPMIHDLSVGYLTLLASGCIFVIGSIIFIMHLYKSTKGNCLQDFVYWELLKFYFRLPCDYVWDFMAYTDPCCIITEVTTTIYSDGRVTDNRNCVECWNQFTYLFKRFILILITIIYYISLIALAVLLGIFKLLYWLYNQISDSINKCKNNTGNTNNNPNTVNIPYASNEQTNGNNNNNVEKELSNQENLESNSPNYNVIIDNKQGNNKTQLPIKDEMNSENNETPIHSKQDIINIQVNNI